MSKLADIQQLLGVTPDGQWGPKSQAALNALVHPIAPRAWPFSIAIEGDDIIVRDIVITCFGGYGAGEADPQDDGRTASGVNTGTQKVDGVSIAMDGRMFSTLRPAEHRALDGAPIPRLLNARGLTAWHTPIEVTIGGVSYTPADGLVDLGPGLQASSPGQPHALDLTPIAAQFFSPRVSLQRLASNFEARGSFRVIGGAKLIRP